jgi:hypothetical protein
MRRLARLVLPAVGLWLLTSAVAAASPRDEVLRLVPEDVGFCLVVQDLRDHAQALANSPFAEQFRQSPLGLAVVNAKETAKLQEVKKEFEKALGLDFARLRDDLFGDAIILAYRPGPPGKSKEEQDLILVRARDAQLLADLVSRLTQMQKDQKELKELEPRDCKGRTYYRHVDVKGENFYYLRGPVLAVSSKEEMLRQAIERDIEGAVGEPPVARELRLLGADKRLAALWINPRAFEAEMEQRAADAQGAQAAVLRTFLTLWKSLDGIALSADVQQDFQLVLSARARRDQLPTAAKQLFAAAVQRSELWSRFPDDALLAVAGRLDAAALLDLLCNFLTTEDRAALLAKLQGSLGAALGGKDVAGEVLPCLGPDWGACVTAPPAGENTWFPQILVAIRVQPGPKEPPVDRALLSAVDSLITWVSVGYNLQHNDQLVPRTEVEDKVGVKYLVNDQLFPPGVRPAYALQGGYLVLASSPEVIRRFAAARATPAAGAEFPLLRMSLKDLRRYVQERHGPLAQAAADKNQVSREEAERRLNGLLIGLQLFDRLEVTQRTAPGQFTLTLRVQTATPLRK